tara:strand:+ start:374 stop:682 length:309 start_codon:yes stop_codon:yes gene_type:complete
MSQAIQVLSYLKEGNRLTSLEAVKLFGTLRLAARILDLRDKGHQIESVTVERAGKKMSQYFIRRTKNPAETGLVAVKALTAQGGSTILETPHQPIGNILPCQ